MSSTPTTPITIFDSHEHSSTPSSPPSSSPVAAMAKKNIVPSHGVTKTEERRLGEEIQLKEVELAKLGKLVEGSKLFARLMQQQFKSQEEERARKAKLKEKQVEKKEAIVEPVATIPGRKATRSAAAEKQDATSDRIVKKETKASSKAIPVRVKNEDVAKETINEYMAAQASGAVSKEPSAEASQDSAGVPMTIGADNLSTAEQPPLVTGGVMRTYQLEGLYWLRTLFENGLNGILADEMGLGKTVQTISLLAHFRQEKIYGPFLVVAPLSTLSNWIEELQKWTPSIPTVLYHGTPAERAELRTSRLSIRTPQNHYKDTFPVVCTSYEIVMRDRKYLEGIGWKYLVVDEGHRMKNKNCRLTKELKRFQDTPRLLITGTPLQNNITELWSLLNYILPQYFDDVANFESLFNFSSVTDKDADPEALAKMRKNTFVRDLHEILKPFLLRRVKTDVETDLPKKREYILYAPLTAPQKELYRQILDGNSRTYLEQQAVDRITSMKDASVPSSRSSSLKRKAASGTATPNKSAKSSRGSTPASKRSATSGRKAGRKGAQKSYKELSDEEYFDRLGETSDSECLNDEEQDELERAKTIELAKKQIRNKKLQNPIMQLRLACNSPHHFYWPWKVGDKDSEDEIPDSTLITHSGKMIMLERLVPYLFAAGHKVLIFSQFKTQLDILHDWASLQHNWPVCRIDGSVPQGERRDQIQAFNTDADVKLFLLSTRAGGQGINLTAADTVILFDSDWNPQQDLQAQDRAHRIGQTRPVIVYRLATKGTVEQTLLEKADGKRRLEKLVIRKGKFRNLLREQAGGNEVDDLADALEGDDFEGYEPGEGAEQLLSEEDLRILTDRSDAAYERAEKGLDAGEKFKTVETKPQGDGLLGEMAL
ncbi:hypothetical protein MMC13_006724 [Lambiella insularis]|nr:hypothetical protein [Lambiella insularis]